ncbi:MAG: 2-oxoisovalerate dehydrogenase [Candidatus Korobacteraceae bacterium]
MESEIIFAVEESPEGGYEARALGYSIFTQGDSLEELREMARDAVRCYFEPEKMPGVIRLHFVHDEVITA